MLQILSNFLSNRHHRTTLNGKTSLWSSIDAGVPQGSVLGPLLFLVYINDITVGLKSEVRIFADDTSLFVVVEDTNYLGSICVFYVLLFVKVS